MIKRIIGVALTAAIVASVCTGFAVSVQAAEAKAPQYQTQARQMEELNRGLVATFVTGKGVYLSWRLLGKENLTSQTYDIYRGAKPVKPLYTTKATDPTNYTDKNGRKSDVYRVVPHGTPLEEVLELPAQSASSMTYVANGDYPYSYVDIPVEVPSDKRYRRVEMFDKNDKHAGWGGGINDASVGDLDGDGDYEFVLKWDPTDSKDAAGGGSTGHVILDGYEIDPKNKDASKNENGHLYKWRIDLGPHVRSGAHENPFLVYDFDGDGRAEIVSITGLGATDGNGRYVTEVGDTEEIRNADNSKTFLRKGKNIGPEYYTIFDGETGAALCTTDAIPIGPPNEKGIITEDYYDGHWYGDAKMNRSSRYLGAVAYVDGVHPSAVMCRGYYNRAMLRAYTWDGVSLKMQWEHVGDNRGTTLYGSGNHNLSVGDIDGDGKDEIVYGSASLDDDGRTALGYTPYGHGDAMHLSDFNNDGIQEVFTVKEDGEGFKKQAENFRVASTGKNFWSDGKLVTSGDNGRGVMANVDDNYAKTHPNALAIGWSSGFANAHDFNGDDIGPKPGNAARSGNANFVVYWDGDLGRELLDTNIICKYDATKGTISRPVTFPDVTANNSTKSTPSLLADLWGDWREEVVYGVNDSQADIDAGKQPALRIFTSIAPTDYRLTTLMHDSQYRLAIAWQNVGYNQPPHTSYYIGSVALATDESGNELNYLAPAAKYTKVKYPSDDWVKVTGIDMPSEKLTIERSTEVDTGARIVPENATRQGIKWTSTDENVVKVVGGKAIGVAPGTATLTAETVDGGFTASREVEVWSEPVTGISLTSNSKLDLQIDQTAQVEVSIAPQNASDKNIKWTSGNEAIATVSSTGIVKAVSSGLTTIYAETVDGGYRTGCMVNVIPRGEEDLSGDDIFKTTNTDSETKLSGASAAGATLSQTASKVGGDMYKDFDVTTDGKATLTYHVTTGGQKDSTGQWKWEGREYTLGMSLLDENGNNILTVSQPYAAGGAGDMTSKVGNDAAAGFDATWSGDRGDIQGSAKRWVVTLEFDYDNDTCDATIMGTDATWAAENGLKTKTFSLNGAHFKTLKFTTTLDNADGAITASPTVGNVSYKKDVEISGSNVNIYKRGDKTGMPWSVSDVSDWTKAGKETLSIGGDTPKLWFNATNPDGGYSAEKTFDNIADTGILTYDIDWHFGNATNRIGNVEYIQIGSDMRLGWMSANGGYYVFPSKDGGATYNGVTGDAVDASKAIFNEKGIHTKKVRVEIDTATRTVKSFKFDGREVTFLKGYVIPEASDFKSVKFGFDRGGSTEKWEYPNGIENITVSQFGEGLTQKLTVKFVNGDTVLKSSVLEVGETPSYDGATPEKAADDKYTYTFKGWTPNIIAAIDDAIYTAEYNKSPKSYSVTLNKNGGTVDNDLTSYTYGSQVTLPVPKKQGMEFLGWYSNSAMTGTPVTAISKTDTGDKTYYAKWLEMDGIRVKTPVSKHTVEGMSLEITGLEIEAHYNDNSVRDVKDFTITGYDKDLVGNQTVTAEYNGFTTEFTITVDAKTATGIVISKKPDKRDYFVGEELSTDGMEITASYNNNTSGVIDEGYTVSGYEKDKLGMQTVTVTYNGLTASFVISVAELPETDSVSKPKLNISSFIGGKTVELTTVTDGASIYYTTDGTAPSAASTLYSSPIEITATTTVKAVAVKSGMKDSTIVSGRISVAEVAAPIASHEAGELQAGTVITLKSDTAGATIYYTTDNTVPSVDSIRYNGAIAVTQNMIIKAIAVKDGCISSAEYEAAYTVPAQETDTITINADTVKTTAGSIAAVSVYMFAESDIGNYRFTAEFDSSVFEYVSITPADGMQAADLFASVDNGKVTVLYQGVAIESGEICTINLKTLESAKDGDYALTFSNIKVTSGGSDAFTFDVNNGKITVDGSVNSNLDKVSTDAVLTDKNGNDISKAEDVTDEVTVNVVVDSAAQETQDTQQPTIVNVILAVYDRNGVLASMDTMEVDISDVNYMFAHMLQIPQGVEVGSIKLMMWNSLSNMSPISQVKPLL